MKNIFRFFGTILTVVLAAALTGCSLDEQLESADLGLHVKVFFPTKVVEGQPMTINGSGFSEVTEIVFPGEVVVKDFQIVSNDMIRVDAPAGIAADGGKIVVRTAEKEAESPLALTLGKTVISGYSAEAGSTVDGGSQITIYGTDLEFINAVELLDADGNPALVEDKAFNKKATASIIFTVPKKVYEGTFVGKVHTIDGKSFDMPELTYKPAADGGYWETHKVMIWENPDPAGIGSVSWSGQYRFYGEGNADTNNECIAMIAADHWNIIKSGTFYLTFAPAADAYQIRANTGWWSFDGDGIYDIHGGDERIVDNGDGTFSLAYTLSEEPYASGLVGLIDEQHLLFTGNGYTPINLYYTEDVWVEGGGGTIEVVRTSIWKNDGSVGAASWSAHIYRFGMEGTDGNNECIATIAPEVWEKMKSTPFNVQISVEEGAEFWQVRMLDGWWSIGNDEANDISPNTPDKFVDNGDGTYTFVVDLQNYPNPDTPLASVVDAQHLLFAGAGFIINELYWEEEVFVPGGGDEPTETVLWVNDGSLGEGTWGNTYRFALEGTNGGDASVDVPADIWQYFKTGPFHLVVLPVADWWQIRVLTGWWSAQWPTADDSGNGDVNVNWTDIVADNGDGTFTVTLDFAGHAILDAMDEQNLLFAGQGFQIQKIYSLQ